MLSGYANDYPAGSTVLVTAQKYEHYYCYYNKLNSYFVVRVQLQSSSEQGDSGVVVTLADEALNRKHCSFQLTTITRITLATKKQFNS